MGAKLVLEMVDQLGECRVAAGLAFHFNGADAEVREEGGPHVFQDGLSTKKVLGQFLHGLALQRAMAATHAERAAGGCGASGSPTAGTR